MALQHNNNPRGVSCMYRNAISLGIPADQIRHDSSHAYLFFSYFCHDALKFTRLPWPLM